MARKTEMNKSEAQDRRRFLRQSAEVAVAGLFAGTALETVVDRVLHRVGETQAASQLAGGVAQRLRGVRLEPQALADECCAP